jgi:outer membrane lipoprotein
MKRAALVLGIAMLAACSRPPRPLVGEFPRTTVRDAQDADHSGERVRWGGTLSDADPRRDETCFEVVSRPLDRRAGPRWTDETYGRFIACAPGFYDPDVYGPDREVTVVGTIEGSRVDKVGDYDYTFPLVRAEVIHLWPERSYYDDRAYYGSGVWVGGPIWWGGWDDGPSHGHYPSRPPGPMIHQSPRGR